MKKLNQVQMLDLQKAITDFGKEISTALKLDGNDVTIFFKAGNDFENLFKGEVIIEKASGKPSLKYLRLHVFDEE